MAVHVGYEPAGSSCTGGPTPGAKALMSWFLGAYGKRGGKNLGIYNCRNVAGSNTYSLHGEGRADDLGVPAGAGWAQTLADKLVANSAELGIQCVIYNRRIWSGSYPRAGWRIYKGSNPHTDHLHVELTRNAARTLTSAKVQAELGGSNTSTPPKAPTAPSFPGRVLVYTPGRSMMRGEDVRRWQAQMRKRGWRIGVDGIYGPKSREIATKFQREKRLTVDGKVGPQTWKAAWTTPIT